MIPAVNGVRFRFDTHIFCYYTNAGFEKGSLMDLLFFVFKKNNKLQHILSAMKRINLHKCNIKFYFYVRFGNFLSGKKFSNTQSLIARWCLVLGLTQCKFTRGYIFEFSHESWLKHIVDGLTSYVKTHHIMFLNLSVNQLLNLAF